MWTSAAYVDSCWLAYHSRIRIICRHLSKGVGGIAMSVIPDVGKEPMTHLCALFLFAVLIFVALTAPAPLSYIAVSGFALFGAAYVAMMRLNERRP